MPKELTEVPHMRNDRAQYVVYGHTHQHQIIPLDLGGTRRLQKICFNTGTWRKVHVRTRCDPKPAGIYSLAGAHFRLLLPTKRGWRPSISSLEWRLRNKRIMPACRAQPSVFAGLHAPTSTTDNGRETKGHHGGGPWQDLSADRQGPSAQHCAKGTVPCGATGTHGEATGVERRRNSGEAARLRRIGRACDEWRSLTFRIGSSPAYSGPPE